MEYVLALGTIVVIFVIPTLIVMALVAKPQETSVRAIPAEPRSAPPPAPEADA